MAEALTHYRYYGFDVADAMPRIFVAVEAALERVLDLADGAVRQRLGISIERITADDWRKQQQPGVISLTQMIGQAVATADVQGLLVPCSLDAREKNLVWFPGNLTGNARITIRKSGELPK